MADRRNHAARAHLAHDAVLARARPGLFGSLLAEVLFVADGQVPHQVCHGADPERSQARGHALGHTWQGGDTRLQRDGGIA